MVMTLDAVSNFPTKSRTSAWYQIFRVKSTRCDANGDILRFHMQIEILYLQSSLLIIGVGGPAWFPPSLCRATRRFL